MDHNMASDPWGGVGPHIPRTIDCTSRPPRWPPPKPHLRYGTGQTAATSAVFGLADTHRITRFTPTPSPLASLPPSHPLHTPQPPSLPPSLPGKARGAAMRTPACLRAAAGRGAAVRWMPPVAVRPRDGAWRGGGGAGGVALAAALCHPWPGPSRFTSRHLWTGDSLKCIVIESAKDLQRHTLKELTEADVVIACLDLLHRDHGAYLSHICAVAGLPESVPQFMHAKHKVRQCGGEPDVLTGVVIPGHPAEPYAGVKGRQEDREAAALATKRYEDAIAAVRGADFGPTKKGVPLEYFSWRRVVVDECHEPLCMSAGDDDDQKDKQVSARPLLQRPRCFVGLLSSPSRSCSGSPPPPVPPLACNPLQGWGRSVNASTSSSLRACLRLPNGQTMTGLGWHLLRITLPFRTVRDLGAG